MNSAYAESAHIPLSKVTARNTQKRAATFTKQAAKRYVENLAIPSAKYDMQQDNLAGCIGSDNSNTAGQGKPGGTKVHNHMASWAQASKIPVVSSIPRGSS